MTTSFLHKTYETLSVSGNYHDLLDTWVYLFLGVLIAILIRLSFSFLLKKTGLQRVLDKLIGSHAKIGNDSVVIIFARMLAGFVFVLFLRLSVKSAGFTDVEDFLNSVVTYLPQLFLAIIIAFLGIRIGNFIYNFVFQAFNIQKDQTAKVLANIARVIVLFFTFTIVLDYTKIVDEFMIRAILMGFVGAVSLAGGLAFGLGGQDFAREVIASFRHGKTKKQKTTEDQ